MARKRVGETGRAKQREHGGLPAQGGGVPADGGPVVGDRVVMRGVVWLMPAECEAISQGEVQHV